MVLLLRFQEVLDRFPRQREPRQRALQYLGRDEQILREYPDDQDACVAALVRMGRSEDAARRYALPPSARAFGLVLAGRLDEAQALDPQNQWVFLAQGRFEEFAGKPGHEMLRRVGLLVRDQTILDRWKDEPINLIDAGRIDAAFEQRNRFGHEVVCLQAKALDQFIHGARADALGRLDACDPLVFHQYDPIWMFHFVAVPFLHELAGESAVVQRSEVIAGRRFDFEQHPWYCARFLAGEISAAEFLAQPHALHAPAQLAFCQAIRAEREGRRTDAVRSYQEFLDLPRWRRNLDLEPVVERFVRWRLQELGAP
ncbi:MAG: hypothetical protein H0W83_14590 [Planctomycetes bacterium]|nr:hypothetical protein [Planctomycetota bacterium]